MARKNHAKCGLRTLSCLVGIGLFAVVAVVMTCPEALAQVRVIKISHASPPSTPLHIAFERFKELVEARSNKRLEVKIFHSQQLMGQREAVEALQLGTLEMTGVPNGVAVAFANAFMLLDIPFQFENLNHARTFIDRNGERFVLNELSGVGLVGLALWEQGYRNLATRNKPVESLADLKDMKIRTLPAPLHVLAWRAMGANPTPMGWGQVYTSLQQGVVEALEVPTYLITQSKLDEVVKYVMTTRHIYDPLAILASKKWFDALPADLQRIVKDTARELTAVNRSLDQKDHEEAEALLPKRGVKLIVLDNKVRREFAVKAQPPVIEEIRHRIGNDKVNEWLASVEQTKRDLKIE